MNHTERLLTTLARKHLPLRKEGLREARSTYAAFIITMHPMDFLKLTTVDQKEIFDIIREADVSLDEFHKGSDPDFNKNRYFMPYLGIYYPSGAVYQHEGRHRAARVLKAGGKSFPVAINCRQTESYLVTWEESYLPDNKSEYKEKLFDNRVEFKKFYEALKIKYDNWQRNPDGISIYGLDYKNIMGKNYRLHPEKRDWTKNDFPDQLIGQYNSHIIIPKSKIKVGLVKGYVYR